MTSGKWWSRKFRSSFPHGNINKETKTTATNERLAKVIIGALENSQRFKAIKQMPNKENAESNGRKFPGAFIYH